jgi:hypothetical protein
LWSTNEPEESGRPDFAPLPDFMLDAIMDAHERAEEMKSWTPERRAAYEREWLARGEEDYRLLSRARTCRHCSAPAAYASKPAPAASAPKAAHYPASAHVAGGPWRKELGK